MSWGFERGVAYNRRADIHAIYGGQWQSGIITPKLHNVIFIISGKRGLDYGYNDRQHADGLVEYFGQGQEGHMTMASGNLAIANHVKEGKSLLFFEKEYPQRHVVFKDEMVCQGWHYEPSVGSDGIERQAIVFELRPLENVSHVVEATLPDVESDLSALRTKAFAASRPSVSSKVSTTTIYQRSAHVRDYVVARAQGKCEGCKANAPFVRASGVPYLEPHHIRRVSDGGPDDPRFVIALCPNCHRHVHFGKDGSSYNGELLKLMKAIEAGSPSI